MHCTSTLLYHSLRDVASVWMGCPSYHLQTPPKTAIDPTSFQNNARPSRQLGAPRLPLAHDLRPRLLRRRNDAPIHAALRPRPTGHNLPSLAAPIRRHDRRRYPNEQNGARVTAGVRSDAGSAVGDFDGQLCERRWVLSL